MTIHGDEAIREALKQYTIDGMMSHLLDAEEDGDCIYPVSRLRSRNS
ncbi:MAG: hypothetical protein MRK00_00180 [Nitrosomonas sp.]|nr:hypothetical protein [Nitrosomonas sp.]